MTWNGIALEISFRGQSDRDRLSGAGGLEGFSAELVITSLRSKPDRATDTPRDRKQEHRGAKFPKCHSHPDGYKKTELRDNSHIVCSVCQSP